MQNAFHVTPPIVSYYKQLIKRLKIAFREIFMMNNKMNHISSEVILYTFRRIKVQRLAQQVRVLYLMLHNTVNLEKNLKFIRTNELFFTPFFRFGD